MRLWQTRFQVVKALESLAMPMEIVLEVQNSPVYHIEERHRKPDYWAQVVCTVEGEGAFRYGKDVYRLTPGRAFLACIGDPLVAYYYPGHASNPWKFIWMSFAGAQAVRIAREMNERYGHVFELPLEKGLVKYLDSFRSQRDSLQMLCPTAGAKIVHDAFAALGETLEGNLSISPQAQLTRAAQEMITGNIDRSMDISLIAEKLHVTREHLSRVFHSQTGMSPGVFAAGERMRAASRMLMDNRLSCKEIGIRLGYDSPSSFARAFKAHFGMSPVEYKERGAENSWKQNASAPEPERRKLSPEEEEVNHRGGKEPSDSLRNFPGTETETEEKKAFPYPSSPSSSSFNPCECCGDLYGST